MQSQDEWVIPSQDEWGMQSKDEWDIPSHGFLCFWVFGFYK